MAEVLGLQRVGMKHPAQLAPRAPDVLLGCIELHPEEIEGVSLACDLGLDPGQLGLEGLGL